MRGAVTYAQQAYDMSIRKLRTARKLYGLTQGQAAVEIGKDQSWISRLEDGKIEPTLKDICEYADVYGLEVRLCDRLKR